MSSGSDSETVVVPQPKKTTGRRRAAAKTAGNQRAQRWCFTLNNPQYPLQFNELTMNYLVFGDETGEEGTRHHQGFVVFKNRKTLSALKELNNRCHWEVAKGTNVQASDYCKKDGAYFEFGEMPADPQVKGGEATKAKWRFIVDKAKAGDLNAIDLEHPKQLVTSYRTLKQIKVDYMNMIPDLDKVCGVWYYGEAGAGKSYKARQNYRSAYLKPCNKWWDGYQGEKNVIIDDFDKNHHVLGHHLKIWADAYSFLAETKGGTVCVRPLNIVVTSQYRICDIFEDRETRTALERRFRQYPCTRSEWDNPIIQGINKKKRKAEEMMTDEEVANAFKGVTAYDKAKFHAGDKAEIAKANEVTKKAMSRPLIAVRPLNNKNIDGYMKNLDDDIAEMRAAPVHSMNNHKGILKAVEEVDDSISRIEDAAVQVVTFNGKQVKILDPVKRTVTATSEDLRSSEVLSVSSPSSPDSPPANNYIESDESPGEIVEYYYDKEDQRRKPMPVAKKVFEPPKSFVKAVSKNLGFSKRKEFNLNDEAMAKKPPLKRSIRLTEEEVDDLVSGVDFSRSCFQH